MTETFTWRAETGTSGSGEFKFDTAQFGDGYSQDSATGLNPERQMWPVSVSGYSGFIEEVLTFIRANYLCFNWKPPMGVMGQYKCTKWNVNPSGGDHWTLSMQFEQTYRP